jgi:fatty acid-binding protein DegV
MLKLHPCIEVNNRDASMTTGKMYRGKLENSLLRYVDSKLKKYDGRIDYRRAFITHTGMPDGIIDAVKDCLRRRADFQNIYDTTASCTISAHCGPGTLGVLFMSTEK